MRTPTELERIRRIRKDLSELTGVDLLEVTALALRKLKDEFHPRLAGLIIGRMKGQDETWLRTLEDGRQDKGYEFRLPDQTVLDDRVDFLEPTWRQLREQIARNVMGEPPLPGEPRRPKVQPDPRDELQAMFRKHGILDPGEEL